MSAKLDILMHPVTANTPQQLHSGPAVSNPALSRYFEISLFLMLLTGVLALVCTGKLDLVTIILAPAALLVKGYRWWHGKSAELSHGAATVLVVLYLFFFRWICGGFRGRSHPMPRIRLS